MTDKEYTFEVLAEVYNVPEYALGFRYWVVTPDGGRLWFYSAWNFLTKAEKAKDDNDRIVVMNPNYRDWRKKNER